MKIKFTKTYTPQSYNKNFSETEYPEGSVHDMSDKLANQMINNGVAETVVEKPVVKKTTAKKKSSRKTKDIKDIETKVSDDIETKD